MVFNGIAIPLCNHMETLGSNFEYRQIPSMNRTSFYSKYREIPSATIWECIRYRWIPLATLNTQIIFFLNVFSDGHEAATKDGDHRPFVREHPLCLFEQIPPKYKYTGNYCWQPKYRQIPRYLTVFGLPTSNTEYCQIPPNTIWELAFMDSNWLSCQARHPNMLTLILPTCPEQNVWRVLGESVVRQTLTPTSDHLPNSPDLITHSWL